MSKTDDVRWLKLQKERAEKDIVYCTEHKHWTGAKGLKEKSEEELKIINKRLKELEK